MGLSWQTEPWCPAGNLSDVNTLGFDFIRTDGNHTFHLFSLLSSLSLVWRTLARSLQPSSADRAAVHNPDANEAGTSLENLWNTRDRDLLCHAFAFPVPRVGWPRAKELTSNRAVSAYLQPSLCHTFAFPFLGVWVLGVVINKSFGHRPWR